MPSISPAVTFDLWHTLIYLEPDDEEAYMRRQVDSAVEVLRSSDAIPGSRRAAEPELRAAFEAEYDRAVAASGEGLTVTPAEQLTRAAEATGRRARPGAYVDALERAVGEMPFRVGSGARSALRELRDRGYSVGVISNTVGEPGRFFRPILRRMGFDDLVQSYTFSDEHPWTKPAPEIFRAALEQLRSRPEFAVHVGDGWSDIEGARRSGMKAGILFTGLQEYGEKYRSLFLRAGWEPPETVPRAPRMADVVPIVRRVLPISG
ncbi:MAG: HAD family hydrolase [Thermoplasmata archaeon]